MRGQTEDFTVCLSTADRFFVSINATVWPPQRRPRCTKIRKYILKRNLTLCIVLLCILRQK